jgi:hypothetical protein
VDNLIPIKKVETLTTRKVGRKPPYGKSRSAFGIANGSGSHRGSTANIFFSCPSYSRESSETRKDEPASGFIP